MLVSAPGSWHRAPETLIISWVKGVSFVLMRWLWVGSWLRAGRWKDQSVIRRLEFSALPPILLRREEAWKWSLWSIMTTWRGLHKNPEVWGLESFHVGEHVEVPREGLDTPHPLHHTLPYASLPSGCSSVSFIISFYKLANVSKYFPEFCEPLVDEKCLLPYQ